MLIIHDKIPWIKPYVGYLHIEECKVLNWSPFSICIYVCENGENCKKMAEKEIFPVLPRVHKKYQLYLQNPKIPKEEVQKKVSNFCELLFLDLLVLYILDGILLCKVSSSISKLKRQVLSLTLPVRWKTGSVSLPVNSLWWDRSQQDSPLPQFSPFSSPQHPISLKKIGYAAPTEQQGGRLISLSSFSHL